MRVVLTVGMVWTDALRKRDINLMLLITSASGGYSINLKLLVEAVGWSSAFLGFDTVSLCFPNIYIHTPHPRFPRGYP